MTNQIETCAAEYGRKCAEAVNDHDMSRFNHLRKIYVHLKWALSTTEEKSQWDVEYNESYRANRVLRG